MSENLVTLKPKTVQFLTDDSTSPSDIGWQKNIFLQINRIMTVGTIGNNESYIRGIEILDKLCEPEKDNIFHDDITQLETKYQAIHMRNMITIQEDPQLETRIALKYYDKLFGIIMNLLKRKGMTPRTNVIDEII